MRAERHQCVDEAKASKEKSLPYCSRKLIFMNMLQVRMTYRKQMLQVKANETRPMMNKFVMRNMSRTKNKLMMKSRSLLTDLNRPIKLI